MTDHQWPDLIGYTLGFVAASVLGGIWLRRWMRT